MSDPVLVEAHDRLACTDPLLRMGYLIELHAVVPYYDWQRLLGAHWATCASISPWIRQLRRALPRQGPLREMMQPREVEAWHQLPARVKLYRGCGLDGMRGLSWTLDYARAVDYSLTVPRAGDLPVVVAVTVPKVRILAVKLAGSTVDVITIGVRRPRFRLARAS